MTNTSMPSVSVLIITYNQEPFIRETLESALRQEYTSLEIVVADDASTDGTAEIVQAYASRYPDHVVPVLAARNCGITANCNRGLKACRGDLVALVGGDDLLYPNKVASQAALMHEHPDCRLSFHLMDVFASDSGSRLGVAGLGPSERSVADLVASANFLPSSSVMVRRSACLDVGFDERVPVASDWLFYVQCARGGPILGVGEVLGGYRRHPGNVTRRSLLADCLRTLDIIDETMPELRSATRQGRSAAYYNEALRLIDAGDVSGARPFLQAGLRLRPASGTLWRWYLASLLGNRGFHAVHAAWMHAKLAGSRRSQPCLGSTGSPGSRSS